MVFRGICAGLGTFLTFAAVILCVFANIGQLTNNIVTRNIRYVTVDPTGLGNALSANGGAQNTNLYANDQSAPEQASNGIKQSYQWGLYSYCAGAASGDSRACSRRSFGFTWEPVDVLIADTPQQAKAEVQNYIPATTFKDSGYLSKYSRPAMYLIFVGSCLALLAWIAGVVSHRFAFLTAALLALLAALCLGVGAALYTAIITRAKSAIGPQYGITVGYGNALWMTWAAFAACALAVIPYILSCCTGRSKYD